jgi:two-component system sensor histidine kinase BaeS
LSFRLRVFLLVTAVAVTAIGATAWLTLSLASREFNRSTQVARQHQTQMSNTIAAYGRTHGSWAGVAFLAERLATESNLRVRLVTISDEVLVDTDHLAGRAGRPVAPFPTLLDPRPTVSTQVHDRIIDDAALLARSVPLPVRDTDTDTDPLHLAVPSPLPDVVRPHLFATPTTGLMGVQFLELQLAQYRAALRALTCIHRQQSATDEPVWLLDRDPYLSAKDRSDYPDCTREASAIFGLERAQRKLDSAALRACAAGDQEDQQTRCLWTAFTDRVSGHSAIPAQLYLGAVDNDPVGLLGRPAMIGAGGLALLALVGTALIARQVSRPVRRLTAASGQLAEGRLDARVPARGRSEMAQLSRSFNTMAEAVQRSEERQRRLVADVAHELRTPLSNLRGYLEGLQDGVVPPTREVFASLLEETLLQRRILDDLQVLALAEAGNLAGPRVPVDIAELAQVSGLAQQAVAAEAGVALHVEAPAPVLVDADPDRLRQVLGNLLSNAVRYTEPGGEVVLRAVAGEGGAVLTVSDTGIGIGPTDLVHVFDRFWRADPARQRTTGGSGLGLTIVKRIVDDHGGLIEVTSRLGVGTTFTVRLPPGAAEPAPESSGR